MVNGKRRRGLRWYTRADQLAGIEALAHTQSHEALAFLTALATYRSQTTPARYDYGGGRVPMDDGDYVATFTI